MCVNEHWISNRKKNSEHLEKNSKKILHEWTIKKSKKINCNQSEKLKQKKSINFIKPTQPQFTSNKVIKSVKKYKKKHKKGKHWKKIWTF